jgi:hypothetical protein
MKDLLNETHHSPGMHAEVAHVFHASARANERQVAKSNRVVVGTQ